MKRVRRFFQGWGAVVVCCTIVVTAGSRLAYLSIERHADQSRLATQQLADQLSVALQRRLEALEHQASERAAAASAEPDADTQARLQSVAPASNAFWLDSAANVLSASTAQRNVVNAIVRFLKTADIRPESQMIGPLREGSRWFVAYRAPLRASSADRSMLPAGWSVVFSDLDTIWVSAGLPAASQAGYEFELAQVDPAKRGEEVFASSINKMLPDPVSVQIPTPHANTEATPGVWRLVLQPRAGWLPVREIVVDASLIALLAWLAGVAVRDAARHASQLRAALMVARRRLRQAHERLSQEIELRARLQSSFEHVHFHDSFTGLPNRRFFLGQLDRALRQMRTRSGRPLGVLLLAVDRFKVVTDTLGHTAGDELMVQITRLFGQVLSSREHVLARWADDALALLVADVASAQQLNEVGRSLQQALQTPMELRRHRIAAAISIGATWMESGLQRTEEVLREADIALNSAKAIGGSNLMTYSATMQNQLMQLVSLESDLHSALARGEFRLLFQPIVDLQACHVVGVEVLLRWLHPVEGLLTPSRFLSFAEDAGLSVPITRWVIERACKVSREWRKRLPPECEFYMSINLSPTALMDADLSDYVAQILRETGTSPASLKFELTESGLSSNVGLVRDLLERLHTMGIELMLDDFGTGYSSLSHLQLFPFDYIKIDGPMHSQQSHNSNAEALLRAMTQMASALGLKTIAEIVETVAAADALQKMGCEYAQGNAFSAPVDAEQAFKRLLANILEPSNESYEDNDSPTMILPALSEEAIS
jgi:diguanylate cyclase (GGDEF)-like protein